MTAATAAGTAADGPPAKKKRGSSGLPRGVTQTGSTKFQGRINYKPPGSHRGQQRAIGTFDTAEEAGLAVAEAEAKLKAQTGARSSLARASTDQRAQAWRGASNAQSPPALLIYTFHHAHLQAPPPERATARRWGVYTTEK